MNNKEKDEVIKEWVNRGYSLEVATKIYENTFNLKNTIGDISIKESTQYLIAAMKKFEITSEDDILEIVDKVSDVNLINPCSIHSLEKAMEKVKNKEN